MLVSYTFAGNGFDHDNIRRMVFNNIWLGIGTSIFASIAIGLGVDFAIHTMDRVKPKIGKILKT